MAKRITLIVITIILPVLAMVVQAADFDGDGTNDIGIFRASSGLWAVRAVTRIYFGGSNDEAMPGDYNGDGTVDFGIFRSSSGLWAIRDITRVYFGGSNDSPLIGVGGRSGGTSLWSESVGDSDIYYNSGYVGIGVDNPFYAALHVRTSISGGYAARFINENGTNTNSGILIQSGSPTGIVTSYLVRFADGDGTNIGDISFTGGAVSYNNFTAEHTAKLSEKDNKEGYPYGTVLRLSRSTSDPERPRQPIYEVEPSVKPYDATVFGVYAGKRTDEDNLHSVYAVGDGHILVAKEGGDISSGDYLTTSSRQGYAMRQNDDLRHSYTVAKALETVDWKLEDKDVKLIACTYQTQ